MSGGRFLARSITQNPYIGDEVMVFTNTIFLYIS